MSLKRWFYRARASQPAGSHPRPGHGRAVRAKQAGVWEVGTVTGTRLSGIGGLLVIVGAFAFVLHVVLRSVISAGVDSAVSAQAGLWVPVNALGALGAALVLLGLPAVYARMAGRGGLPGLVGFALIEVSWMFFGLFLSLYGALVLPWLADQAPRLVARPLGVRRGLRPRAARVALGSRAPRRPVREGAGAGAGGRLRAARLGALGLGGELC